MKKPLLISILAISTTASVALAAWSYLGLDNNAADSVDPVLETAQPNEELGFSQVANLIGEFVQTQYDLRIAHVQNFETEKRGGHAGKYSAVYSDLPGQSAYATRDVHRKTQGCYSAKFSVNLSLASDMNATLSRVIAARVLAPKPGPMPQLITNASDLGRFQPGATYDAVVRYSNGHPMNRADRLPDARGFAVKLLKNGTLQPKQKIEDLDAESLNAKTELDILSINFPTFFVTETKTASKYYKINEYFLHGALDFSRPTKDKADEGLSIFASGIGAMEIRLAQWVNGSVLQSPLYQNYYSMVPSRLGPKGSARAVKYEWRPEACQGQTAAFETDRQSEWPAWSNQHHYAHVTNPLAKLAIPPYSDEKNYPRDYLRANIEKSLHEKDFCYGLYLQPYTDELSTNIEDSTDIWLNSEAQRSWWLTSVVPGNLDPAWKLFATNRDAYIAKIKAKAVTPAVRAAVLRIGAIDNDSRAENSKTCEDLSFNPWSGDIDHHKPLGVISRLKRRVYNASRRLRHALNGEAATGSERQH